MADALGWLGRLLGDDPEAAGAAQNSTAMQPGVLDYLQDVVSGRVAAEGVLQRRPYDPALSYRQNVPDLRASLEQAMPVALGFGPGVIMRGMPRPTTFYRGTVPGRTERISTGNDYWDNRLFLSSDRDAASMYGGNIAQYAADPAARILYHGTRDFNSLAKGLPRGMNLLDYSAEVLRRAEAAGYDAVHFQRQGDVGTAVINPAKFKLIED